MADVIVDMRQTQLTQVGKDRVHVKGTRGYQPTPYVKCCGIFMDGWQVSGELIIGGHEAKQKVCGIVNRSGDTHRLSVGYSGWECCHRACPSVLETTRPG